MPDEQPPLSALVSPQSAESVPAWQYVEGGFQCVLPRGAVAPQLVITEFDAHEFASTPYGSRTGTYVTEITIEFNVSSDTPLSNTDIAAYILVETPGEGEAIAHSIGGVPLSTLLIPGVATTEPPFLEEMIGTGIVVDIARSISPSGSSGDTMMFYQRAFWSGRIAPAAEFRVGFDSGFPTGVAEFYPNFTWAPTPPGSVTTMLHPLLGSWKRDTSGWWDYGRLTVPINDPQTPPPLQFPLKYEFPEVTTQITARAQGSYFVFTEYSYPTYAALGEVETLLNPSVAGTGGTFSLDLTQNTDDYGGFLIVATWPGSGQTYVDVLVRPDLFYSTPDKWPDIVTTSTWDANEDGTPAAYYGISTSTFPLWGNHLAPSHYSLYQPGSAAHAPTSYPHYPDLFCIKHGVDIPYYFSETLKPQHTRWDVNTFWRDSNLKDFTLVVSIMPPSDTLASAIITVSDVKLTVKTTTTTENIAHVPTAQPDTVDIQRVLTFSPRRPTRPIDPPPLDIAEGGLVSMEDGVWLLTTINKTEPANTVTYADDVAVGGSTTVAPSNSWDITYQDIESNIVDPETGQPLQLNVVSTCKTSLQGGIITAQLLRVSDFPTAVPENAIIQNMTLSFDADAQGGLVEHYIALYLTPPGEPVIVGNSIDNGTQQVWSGNTRIISGTPTTFLSPEIYAVYGQLLKTQQWGIIFCTAFHDDNNARTATVINNSSVAKETPISISNISMTFEWTLPPPPPSGGAAALPAPTILSIPSTLRARPQTKNASSSTAQSVSAGLLPTEGIIIGVPGDFRSHTLNKKK